MADTVVLRKIYALNSNTGLFLSTNQVLLTDGKGGTTWIPLISSLAYAGGPIIGDLPSTISTISSQIASSFTQIDGLWSSFYAIDPGNVGPADLVSSVRGLGSSDYVSSLTLFDTLGSVSTQSQTALTSSLEGLGTFQMISTPTLLSTLNGLGTLGYVSTASLFSTLDKSFSTLTSSITGLGTAGYISSSQLTSTVAGLGVSQFINNLNSSIVGLGSFGYVSSTQLASTTNALLQRPTRFDNVGNCFIQSASSVTFSNVTNVYYVSSFVGSSLQLSGSFGTQNFFNITDDSNVRFSTASFSLAPFSNYILSSTRIILEFLPTYLFSSGAAGAGGPLLLTMSTMLAYSNTTLGSTLTNSFIHAWDASNSYGGGQSVSTLFQQTIKFEIPPSTAMGKWDQPLTLLHFIPGGFASNAYSNGFAGSNVTSYFSPSGSAFLNIQNLP